MDIINVPKPAITQKLLVYPKDPSSLLLEQPHGAHYKQLQYFCSKNILTGVYQTKTIINRSSFCIGLRISISIEEYDWREHTDICRQMDQ